MHASLSAAAQPCEASLLTSFAAQCAAFVVQDAPLAQLSSAPLRATLAAKASGSANLASATRGTPLASIVHFSSLSALLGTAGQANYAAANEVLNSHAAAQRAAGAPAVAVGWGPWATGMAAADARLGARFERAGLGLISPAAGLAALSCALQSSSAGVELEANIVAARVDWPRLMAVSTAAAAAPIFASFRPQQAAQVGNAFISATAESVVPAGTRGVPQQSLSKAEVQKQLQDIVAGMLGPNVSVDAPLMESGLDSLSAVELRNNLSGLFGAPLPATVTFDYPSISALAGYIAAHAAKKALSSPSSGDGRQSPRVRSATTAEVRAQLTVIVERMLGAAVPANQPLMEAGLDSLSAVELRNTLADAFRLDQLPATLMFDYPSVDALVSYIAERTDSAHADVHLTGQRQLASPVQTRSDDTPQGTQQSRLTELVGASARYPGDTQGVTGFWAAASSAADLQRRVPLDRWDVEPLYAADVVPGSMAINAPFAAFCVGVAEFDSTAFGLSPTEAVTVDPQQRLLMEETAGALADAAPRCADLSGSLTGVYVCRSPACSSPVLYQHEPQHQPFHCRLDRSLISSDASVCLAIQWLHYDEPLLLPSTYC